MLWLSPVIAAAPLPGATAEGVAALARRINPTVAAAALDFHAALHKIGTAGVLADPTLVLEAWDVNRQVGQRRIGVDQDVKLWDKYGLERGVAQADADAARFQGRATVTEPVAQVITAHGEYNAACEAVAISQEIKRRFDEILSLLRSRYGATAVDQQDADAWFGVDALRKVVQIYLSRQLPPARSSVDNARNGFQAGTTDLSAVFEAERRLRAVQLDLLRLRVELQAKYAEMERLAGGSL